MGFYQEKVFPFLLNKFMRHEVFDVHRKKLLSHAKGKTLEIGIGTGANLNFYSSEVTEIEAIDSSTGMADILKKKLTEHSELKVNFQVASAEKLPYDSSSFDTVVSTLTLCSIKNLDQALQEIKRVLKPQGQFLFFEHGLSPDQNVQRWQNWLTPIQNVVGCGCSFNVPIASSLLRNQFQLVQLENFYLEKSPKVSGYIYQGQAQK